MKAIVKRRAEEGLWMEDVPIPKHKPNEVLIKVKKASICGTDVHIYKWDEWSQKAVKVPVTIGHEFMGEIAEAGSQVKGFKVGQRVSVEGHITCGYCRNCRGGTRHLCVHTIGVGILCNGGFAKYVAIPAENTFPLPDEISDEVGAFLDPLGNAVHTALSFDLVGEDVLITGSGPIGLMAAAIAKHVGARRVIVTDINDYRLDLAEKMGATAAINIKQTSLPFIVKQQKMVVGFDVIMEMSGSPEALQSIFEVSMHGAKIALLGIPTTDVSINWHHVIFKGLFLKGIYGREIFETWYKMVSMLQSGLDVTPVITHRFPAEEFEKGFHTMMSGESGKVILDWEN